MQSNSKEEHLLVWIIAFTKYSLLAEILRIVISVQLILLFSHNVNNNNHEYTGFLSSFCFNKRILNIEMRGKIHFIANLIHN